MIIPVDYTCSVSTPLGAVTLASDGEALTGLWFDGQKHFGATLSGACQEERELPVFTETARWLDRYFSGAVPERDPPLAWRNATAFQMAVWELLRAIPYGEVTTYGELAARLSRQRGAGSGSARAVGSAVARNPISLIVPCHRVLGAGGRLTGYAGGIERKAALLRLEGIVIPSSRPAPYGSPGCTRRRRWASQG